MLQVDPMKRATIEDIKNHEWFQKDLPAYLFPPVADQDSSIIDTDCIKEVCEKFNVKESEVYQALMSQDPHDQLAIAYHLIIDNKRIADEAAKFEIRDFYLAGSPPPVLSDLSPSPVRPHPERIAPHLVPLRERFPSGGNGEKQKGTPIKKAKWHLGIRSQSRPHDIMNEVFRAMKSLGFEWKVVNAYHVLVRRKNSVTGQYVKMSLQLYQVDYKSFLLDFKSLSSDSKDSYHPDGPGGHYTMEFFEMCAALITQLAR